MKIAISWLFFIYFAVLGTERVRSLFPIGDGGLFPTAFDGYVNLMTVLSLLATVVLLIGFNGGFWRSLFGGATPDYRMLVITAGVLLLSGMVHTEHTVAPVRRHLTGFRLPILSHFPWRSRLFTARPYRERDCSM